MSSLRPPAESELEALRRRVDELANANDGLKRQLAGRRAFRAAREPGEVAVRRLVDGISALALVMAPSGEVVHANPPAVDYFGRPTAEIALAFRHDLIHPHDQDLVADTMARCMTASAPFDVQLRLRRSDGVYRWFEARALPLTDARARLEHWYLVLTDIEHRKRSEDDLKVRELGVRLLGETMETMPALALVTNSVGEILYANQQVLDYYGTTLAGVQAYPTSAWILHPDDLEHANRVIAAANVSRVTTYDEYRLRRHDGVYRWFEGRYSPLKNADGEIINWYNLLIDIDDRKRSEERLRESEAFLAETQRLSSTGGFRWRVDTDDMTWSEELRRIFAFEPETPPVMDSLRGRIHPHDRAIADDLIAQARGAGRNFEAELRLLLPDSAVKSVRLVARAERSGDGRLEYVGAVQDVSRQRASEAALGEVRQELARMSRVMMLGAVTASIAHEVSQPLGSIALTAGTCLRMLSAATPDVEGAKTLAERVLRDANRATDVVRRLRSLFGKAEPSNDLLELNEAAREVIALASDDLRRANVVVRTELAEGLPPVRGDRVQLQQVMLNLVLNGAQAMSGLADRTRELTITTCAAEGGARLSVRDRGVGVDPETVETLFKPFHTTKPDGMGIGLAISRSIIEVHGGSLTATPNPGPGATFSFHLPAARP